MMQGKGWVIARPKQEEIAFLLLILALGLAFFVRNAHLELTLDDLGWLRGQSPTVFDHYRHIPRLFFAVLYALFGPNAIAALAMTFTFHATNTLLVYGLCRALMGSLAAARAAAFAFLVNPITLATLTWISCFSYVLGTSLALVSLLAFWRSITGTKARSWLWWGVALACYVAALFCSHQVFFLPLLFPLLCWLRGMDGWRRGVGLFFVAMALALLIQRLVYSFEQYGVETIRLFTLGFISALVSSVLSFGASLTLAYPLSFFVKPTEFLRVSFSEPVRWVITMVLLAAAELFYRRTRAWRVRSFLALSFAVLIAPYVIRLYLTSDWVSYHISYVLSGRVFYLPFVIIALAVGWVASRLAWAVHVRRALYLLVAVAYAHASFLLYDRADFMGLQVLQGQNYDFPPPWTPYTGNHPIWLAGLLLVVIIVVTLRFLLGGLRGSRGSRSRIVDGGE